MNQVQTAELVGSPNEDVKPPLLLRPLARTCKVVLVTFGWTSRATRCSTCIACGKSIVIALKAASTTTRSFMAAIWQERW